MKKTLLLLTLFVGIIFGASAQCIPDTTHFTSGNNVYPVTLPCITPNVAYSEVQTILIPDSVNSGTVIGFGNYSLYVDSVSIDSIVGYPTGISSVSNPALHSFLKPGGHACATFSGTTAVANGNDYVLTIYGTACGHATFPVVGYADSCIKNQVLSRAFPDTLKTCPSTGIADVSGGLNLTIFPNPNQGNFTVTLSSSFTLIGTLSVMDQLGRTINTQNIEVTGTKQIPLELGNVAPGAYLLIINTDGARSVKQFIVK